MKRILALSLVLIVSISLFTGCGGSGNDIVLTGKYTLVTYEQDGEEILTEMMDMLKEFGMAEDDFEMYIEFQSGGKFKLVMSDEEEKGTFKVNGTAVTLTTGSDDLKGKMEGNTIVIEENDPDDGAIKMVFEKK